MLARNQHIVFPESAMLTYGSSRHQRLQLLVLYISTHGILHDVALLRG